MFPIEIFDIIALYNLKALMILAKTSKRFHNYFADRLKCIKYKLIHQFISTMYPNTYMKSPGISFSGRVENKPLSVVRYLLYYNDQHVGVSIDKRTVVMLDRVRVCYGKSYRDYMM